MLYDGVLKFGAQAEKALDNQDISAANKSLNKMQDILYELIACLDIKQGGEVAQNLQNIYTYSIDLLIQANMQKDKSKVTEVVSLVSDIRSAWEQIGKEVSIGKI
ncbi:Flagellar protein FliS [compost metagenome]